MAAARDEAGQEVSAGVRHPEVEAQADAIVADITRVAEEMLAAAREEGRRGGLMEAAEIARANAKSAEWISGNGILTTEGRYKAAAGAEALRIIAIAIEARAKESAADLLKEGT